VGDYVPMYFRNDGSETIDKLILSKGFYGAVTIKDWSGLFDIGSCNDIVSKSLAGE